MLKDFTLSLELEPTENRVVQTAAIFWSHDVNTAKIYIELLRKGTPIILNKDVTVRVMMLFDDENKSEHIYTAKIEDELKGLVSITLEESMRMYVGQVTCGVYVDYQNEEKTDNGYFTFGMRRSLIDKDMPELQKLYVSDFEKALEDIKEFKVDIDKNIIYMTENFNSNIKEMQEELNKKYDNANDKINEINKHIAENDVATKQDLNKVDVEIEASKEIGSSNFSDTFIPPKQKNIHAHFSGGDVFKQGDKTLFDEINAMFSDLVKGNEDYITQYDLGTDSGGWRHFYYYVFEPKKYKKTMILGSGTHGGEKAAIVTLANFLNLLVNEYNDYPQLSYIRNNVRLVVMPIQNPYGVYFNSRNTENKVDINRNFDYEWDKSNSPFKGDKPFSEFGSQNIKTVLEKYSEATTYLDLHNMSTGDRDFSETCYIPSKEMFPTDDLLKLMKEIQPKRSLPGIEILSFSEPTSFNYASKKHEMVSFNPEYVPGNTGGVAYDEQDMTHAMRFYGNIIIHFALNGLKNSFLFSEPQIYYKSEFYLGEKQIPLTEGFSLVSNSLQQKFTPMRNGVLKVSYQVTVNCDENVTRAQVFPVVHQEKNKTTDGFSPDNSLSWFAERFSSTIGCAGVFTLNATAYMPVTVGQGLVFAGLAANDPNSGTKISRVKQQIEFIPSERDSRLNFIYRKI